jgi:hypothetical protein
MPAPPDRRAHDVNPWPTYPMIMRVSSAHEEGGERLYSVNTERFLDDGNGNVRALLLHEVERVDGRFQKIEGTERELPADLVFLAMGFTGAQREGLVDELGVEVDGRGNVARDAQFMATEPGVFAPPPRRPTAGSPATRCCRHRSARRRSPCVDGRQRPGIPPRRVSRHAARDPGRSDGQFV